MRECFPDYRGDLDEDESPDPEDENAVIPPEAAKRTGVEPTFAMYKNREEEAKAVVERIHRCLLAGTGPGPLESYMVRLRTASGMIHAGFATKISMFSG